MENENTTQPNQTGRRLKIFGVGGAGIAILNRLIQSGLENVDFIAVSTDAPSLASSPAPQTLLIESKRLRGLGTGGDPIRGAKAAEENVSKLRPLCGGADMAFVVAGLGGGTGSGVGPVIAKLAKQAGALVTGFVVLPFSCEGDARSLHATRALESMKTACDGVICLPNDKILKLIHEDAGIVETFDKAGALLAEGVLSVWRLVHLKGPIDLNFEDLGAVLRDRHSENLFAVAEGSGAERITEVIERLRAHPLLDEGRDLERADAVLVSVVSGSDLSMAEINRLMGAINEACARARVSMGVATSAEYAGRVLVTVIVSCRSSAMPLHDPEETNEDSKDRGVAGSVDELFPRMLEETGGRRTGGSRHVPPPPELTPDRLQQVAGRKGIRHSQPSSRMRQVQLPLEAVSKGRFDKGEPTVIHGEDLDMPTYVRRGVSLN